MDEIIDGFLVTEGRKKLWEIELQIIDLVEEICVENDLNYFLIGGAAIGAVRHHGFIPWDDDMDIGMLRKDFDKFVKAFEATNSTNYVMEYGFNKESCNGTFLRIRDKNTTAIIRSQFGCNKEHGVYVEIYPFDKVITSNGSRNKQIKASRVIMNELNHRIDDTKLGLKGKILHYALSFCSTEKLWSIWYNICTKYNDTQTDMVDTIALPYYAAQGIHLYQLDSVTESEYVDYSNHKVRLAKGNDCCLKIHFGDYMRLPPVEERGMKHSVTVFYDAFTPWEKYMTQGKDTVERFFQGDYKLSNIW